MKKKFLSLMMAAAMVATTSVSAFAKDYSWSDNLDKEINVDITGNVQDQNGHTTPGSLSVSVPTTASFTVSNNRTVQSASIRVENKGTTPIDVYAYKFADQTPDENSNITVVGKSSLSTADTTATLTLKLSGNRGYAHLKSEAEGNGIYTHENCETQNKAQAEGIKLAYVDGSDSQDITLSGETKENANLPGSPVKDNFVLTLKIKKAQS